MDESKTSILNRYLLPAAIDKYFKSKPTKLTIDSLVTFKENNQPIGQLYADEQGFLFNFTGYFESPNQKYERFISLDSFDTHHEYIDLLASIFKQNNTILDSTNISIEKQPINQELFDQLPSCHTIYQQVVPVHDTFKTEDDMNLAIINIFERLNNALFIGDMPYNVLSTENLIKSYYTKEASYFNNILSHYMFSYQNQKFFFTSQSSDWHNQYKSSFLQQDSTDMMAIAITSLPILSSLIKTNNDAEVANLVFAHWPFIFNQKTYLCEDGTYHFINTNPENIFILPAKSTIEKTTQNQTGKLIIL